MSLQEIYELHVEPKCKVCVWLDKQTEEDRAFFNARAAENVAKMTAICMVLLGLDAHVTTVRKHVKTCR